MNNSFLFRGSVRLSTAVVLAIYCLLSAGGSAKPDLEARRRQVAQMTPTEKARLHRLWERFEALPPQQRENIRQLDHQIAGDALAEELKNIMRRYYQWCRTLPAYQRLELRELPVKQRIVKIKSLKQQTEDAEGMKRWFDAKADRIAANLSDENRKYLSKYGPFAKRILLFRWMNGMSDKSAKTINNPLNDRDLNELRSHLSERTRKLLEKQTPQEQWKTIVKHVRRYFQAQTRRHRRPDRRPDRHRGISTEDLAGSFQKLPPSRQDALLSLPAEEMLQQLQQIHIEHSIGSRRKIPNNRHKRFPPGKKRSR